MEISVEIYFHFIPDFVSWRVWPIVTKRDPSEYLFEKVLLRVWPGKH